MYNSLYIQSISIFNAGYIFLTILGRAKAPIIPKIILNDTITILPYHLLSLSRPN